MATDQRATGSAAQQSKRRVRRSRRSPPSLVSRRLSRAVKVLAAGFVVFYLVVPQIPGTRKALNDVAHANLSWLAAGILLEAAAIVAYALLGRAMLPSHAAPRVPTLLRIQLATKAVTNVVPGGSAAGSAVGFGLLKEAGVTSADATFAVAMQSIGSAVVLNVVLWIGLLVSIGLRGWDPLFGTAAVAGFVVIGAFFVCVVGLARGEERAIRAVRWVARKAPLLEESSVERGVRRIAQRLRELARDRRLLTVAVLWAALNWLLDAASLWAFLGAFGVRVSVDALVVSFGLANVLAAIPITPGGLGILETVMITAVVGFGSPRSGVILAVITYRLISFWLPIPLGALSYLSLQFVSSAERNRRARLRAVAEDAIAKSEDPREWAARHGVRFGRAPAPGEESGTA